MHRRNDNPTAAMPAIPWQILRDRQPCGGYRTGIGKSHGYRGIPASGPSAGDDGCRSRGEQHRADEGSWVLQPPLNRTHPVVVVFRTDAVGPEGELSAKCGSTSFSTSVFYPDRRLLRASMELANSIVVLDRSEVTILLPRRTFQGISVGYCTTAPPTASPAPSANFTTSRRPSSRSSPTCPRRTGKY